MTSEGVGIAQRRRLLFRVLRWVAVVGVCVAAVLYTNWLLEIVFRREADPDLFISELAALDQPYGAWFRWGDRLTAIVLFVASAAGLVVVRGSKWSTWAWWVIVAFAFATLLDSTVWNMDCAEHSNPACKAAEKAGTVPIGDQLHILSSAIAFVGAIVSMFFFFLADLSDGTPESVRRFGRLVLAALVATAVWTGLAFAVDAADESGQVGISQRAFLTATAIWLVYVGVRTARTPLRRP